MPQPVFAYIGLGSNLGDRDAALRGALDALISRPGVLAVRASAFQETAPWGEGCEGQPPYLNGAAEILTILPPTDLLRALQAIENRFGRTRPARWAPRTLDLDLLLYGDQIVRTAELEVPHPRLAERRFVLDPLARLAPDLVVPGTGKTVRALLEACP